MQHLPESRGRAHRRTTLTSVTIRHFSTYGAFRIVAVIFVCEFGIGDGNSWLLELPTVGGSKSSCTPLA